MANSSLSVDKGNSNYLKVTQKLVQPNYKQRIGRTGRKSKELWKTSEEIDGIADYCLMCGCPICVNQLPYPKIIFDGFVETGCWKFIRTLRS